MSVACTCIVAASVRLLVDVCSCWAMWRTMQGTKMDQTQQGEARGKSHLWVPVDHIHASAVKANGAHKLAIIFSCNMHSASMPSVGGNVQVAASKHYCLSTFLCIVIRRCKSLCKSIDAVAQIACEQLYVVKIMTWLHCDMFRTCVITSNLLDRHDTEAGSRFGILHPSAQQEGSGVLQRT